MTTLLRLCPVIVAVWMQTAAPETGFTSLFNGKDFTDWKISGNESTFTVKDGAMVANGPVAHAYYDGPFRNHAFRNFELKVARTKMPAIHD